ncbi:MAG: hypothetical protein QOG06_90 [Gaiellaceae bacterium]|jgi:hypothetical protein|nr:hypothetical protein [Gaiellaceae bacterium]
MRRALLAAALLLLSGAPVAQAAGIAVSMDRTAVATKIGHKFVLRARIENRGGTAAAGLVAHLNVVDLTGHTYVDPEDWSTSRTRYPRPIPAGGTTALTWRVNAVNSGTIGIYVAVLPTSGAPVPPVTGPTVRVRIQDRKTLNSGGILPLALGIPGALGLLALVVRLGRGRQHSRGQGGSG